MSNKFLYLFFAVYFFAISSCSKKPDIEGTASEKVANEWWVTFTVNGNDVYHLGTTKLVTYNTSDNNGDIWIDDYENTWEYKVKAQVDYNSLTFKATNAKDTYNGISVNITDGKILKNAAKSKTGNVTDSIYMKIVFSDDPQNIYTVAGHARTRFAEDEY